MSIVIDTNVFISALMKDGATRNILLHEKIEFISISFSEEEIRKYRELILKKSNLDEETLDNIFEQLKNKVTFLDDAIIGKYFEEAKKIMWDIDPKDTPFIAAALATQSDIWSNDKHFEKQDRIKVWKTKNLIEKRK
jgi:predicted nucleic acid-binding protein